MIPSAPFYSPTGLCLLAAMPAMLFAGNDTLGVGDASFQTKDVAVDKVCDLT